MINIVFEQDKDDVLSSGDLIDLKTIDTFLVTSFFETNLLSLFFTKLQSIFFSWLINYQRQKYSALSIPSTFSIFYSICLFCIL